MSKAINIFLSLKPAFKIRTALNKEDKTIKELLEDKDCNKDAMIIYYLINIDIWISKTFTTDEIINQIITEDKLVEFIILTQNKFNEYFC